MISHPRPRPRPFTDRWLHLWEDERGFIATATAIGLAIAAGSTVASSAIAAHTATKAREAALTESDRQKQTMDAQTGLAKTAQAQGQQLIGAGMPAIRRATDYYSRLMGAGGRGAMTEAVAPAAENISSLYTGAEKGLERQGITGGEKDTALADLNRERVGQVAGLVRGVQPAAASAVGDIGTRLVGAGTGLYGTAGSSYGNLSSLATGQNMFANQMGFEQGGKTAGNLGSLFGQLMNMYGYGQRGPKGPPSTGYGMPNPGSYGGGTW